MNSVKIKRGKSINVPKGIIYNVFFSKYEYIHARWMHTHEKNSIFINWY